MKQISLITVGKLKDNHLEALEENYLKRLKFPKLQVFEVKANARDKGSEASSIQKKLDEIRGNDNSFVVALTEFGEEYDSPAFSKWLYRVLEKQNKLIFVIAGADGFSSQFLEQCDAKLSLSKLTFPHKIARILFVEQVYRAMTIQENHPYHN